MTFSWAAKPIATNRGIAGFDWWEEAIMIIETLAEARYEIAGFADTGLVLADETNNLEVWKPFLVGDSDTQAIEINGLLYHYDRDLTPFEIETAILVES